MDQEIPDVLPAGDWAHLEHFPQLFLHDAEHVLRKLLFLIVLPTGTVQDVVGLFQPFQMVFLDLPRQIFLLVGPLHQRQQEPSLGKTLHLREFFCQVAVLPAYLGHLVGQVFHLVMEHSVGGLIVFAYIRLDLQKQIHQLVDRCVHLFGQIADQQEGHPKQEQQHGDQAQNLFQDIQPGVGPVQVIH